MYVSSHSNSVTSVGGTEGHAPETAWAGSSGGFSNYFPIPAYQAPALSAYLAAHGHASSAAERFNASGRGFPDVAAKADDFRIALSADGSSTGSVYGTSAASPTFARLLASRRRSTTSSSTSPARTSTASHLPPRPPRPMATPTPARRTARA